MSVLFLVLFVCLLLRVPRYMCACSYFSVLLCLSCCDYRIAIRVLRVLRALRFLIVLRVVGVGVVGVVSAVRVFFFVFFFFLCL